MFKIAIVLCFLINFSKGCNPADFRGQTVPEIIKALSIEFQGKSLPVDYPLAMLLTFYMRGQILERDAIPMLEWIRDGKWPIDRRLFEGVFVEFSTHFAPEDSKPPSKIYSLVECFRNSDEITRVIKERLKRISDSEKLKTDNEKKRPNVNNGILKPKGISLQVGSVPRPIATVATKSPKPTVLDKFQGQDTTKANLPAITVIPPVTTEQIIENILKERSTDLKKVTIAATESTIEQVLTPKPSETIISNDDDY